LRRRIDLNCTNINLDGTPAATSGGVAFYGKLPVNTGCQVRVVRIIAQNLATAKGGEASTEPVVAIYRCATTVLASCSAMTLTCTSAKAIGATWEGTDDSTGILFSASDYLAADLYTAAVAASNNQGEVRLSVEYIDGPLK